MLINGDCYDELLKLGKNSIDLILIDPPYNISRSSGFTRMGENTNRVLQVKYNMSIDFGEWDKEELNWDLLFAEFFRILKKGGSLIIFYDIWKAHELKEAASTLKFKQPRVGSWVKNNPVPINSSNNYLSNAVEYFFTFVKSGKPTFNSKYDNGIYHFPLCHGRERLNHPTQKPLGLIKELILKHSNPGDLVLDCFSGSGTTAHAAIETDRKFIAIEKETIYYNISKIRIDDLNKSQ